MIPEFFSVSVSPIVPWPVLIVAIGTVTALTLWAYRRRLRGTTGNWRWVAADAAIAGDPPLPAGGAATLGGLEGQGEGPGVLDLPGRPQPSMTISDEVNNKSRWAVANEVLEQARAGEGAGARPRRPVLRLRRDGRRAQGRGAVARGRAEGAGLGARPGDEGCAVPPAAIGPPHRPHDHHLGFRIKHRGQSDARRASDSDDGLAGRYRGAWDRDRRRRGARRDAAEHRRRRRPSS